MSEPTFEDKLSHVRALQINLEASGQYDDAAALAAVLARLGEMERDKERLDWLEATGRRTTMAMFEQNGGFLVSDEGDVLSGTIDAGYEFTQLREAIDDTVGAALASRADAQDRS